MDNDLVKLLKSVQGTPLYQQLADYLMARRAMPEIKSGYLGEGVNGNFSRNTFAGGDLPRHGQITLSDRGLFQDMVDNTHDSARTLTHEMNHAADSQMSNHYYELKRKPNKTPEEERFVKAYDKLVVGLVPNEKGEYKYGRRETELANRIAPEWTRENEKYRASGDELPAFGVGNSAFPSKYATGLESPPHLDSSLAQERSILLDAAMRAQRQAKILGR